MTGDPPLGECPPWCQKDPGHDWEDRWQQGLIRYHTWREQVSTASCGPTCIHTHEIGVDEVEQWIDANQVRARLRQVVLDVEAPTNLSATEAVRYTAAIAKAALRASEGLTEEHEWAVR